MKHAMGAQPLGGVGIMLAGAGILVSASGISQGFGYDVVGPATMPRVIALGLIVSGALIILEGRNATSQDVASFGRMFPVLLISAAILLAAFGIRIVGWVPVAAIIFGAGAYAFGGRRLWVNALIGLAFGTATLILFNYGLGLNLPLGTVWRAVLQG